MPDDDGPDALVERIATLADRLGCHVAVAESLTSGLLASRLGAGPQASRWFRGGIVAYGESVKFGLLGVEEGPVVTERCARQMTDGASRLLDAAAVVAATGVGGPEPAEGLPAGTVCLAARYGDRVLLRTSVFDGSPPAVIDATTEAALDLLCEAMTADS